MPPLTRLAVVDHVTSPTALVFPVREIVTACRARGVRVLVDGAHAPGMVELDVPALGADWYVGNCHKWLCAPKGCAFLWAAKKAQRGLHPAVVSNRYGEGFLAEFDWCGTKDPSPWLSIGAALDFHAALGGKFLRRRNHDLAVAMGARLARAWGAETAPPELCGSMVALRLPLRGAQTLARAERFHAALWKRRIEVPVFLSGGRLFVRVSAQAYNEPAHYHRLERALPGLLDG
ncbi:MAG: aminotransferase class V-fold PLP-dependent enzyme [Elusimicrobiota bacterium]